MTKEEILNEIEEIKESILVSNRRIADLENELKKLEEPKPWKPEIGETYYYVDSSHARVSFSYWEDDEIDNERYNVGNCFPTEERAKQVAEKIRMLLKLERYHDMFCPDFVPDWEADTYKYFIYYDTSENKWDCDWVAGLKRLTEVYFDSEETAQKVCDLLNREE